MSFLHSEVFDALLVIAGLALVIIGLVSFIRSKASGDASSVEAFGIKLNVTHPSLILVVVGVGLMLAPRLLPGLPGAPPRDDGAVAEETKSTEDKLASADAPVVPDDTRTPSTASAPSMQAHSEPAERPAAPVTRSGSSPTPTPKQPAAETTRAPAPNPTPTVRREPARTEAPRPVATTPDKSAALAKAAPAPVAPRAETTPTPPSPAPSRPAPSETTTAPASSTAAPATTPKPARPTIAFASLGLPSRHDFWSGESSSSYTRRMQASVRQASQNVLRMAPHDLALNADAFDRWWNESRDMPVSRSLCSAAAAPRALVSARIETPTTTSQVESAYWPELSLRLYHCATDRVYRQKRTLSPSNRDDWPFSSELNADIERFLRTYRADLAD